MRSVVAGLIATLICCGCSVRPTIPVGFDVELNPDTAKVVAAEMITNQQGIQSLRAITRAKLVHRGRVSFIRYVVAINSDKAIRLDILPDRAGYPLGLYVQNATQASFIVPSEKKVYYGDESLLQEALGVPVPATDLLTLLTARIAERVLLDPALRILTTQSGDELLLVLNRSRIYRISPTNHLCRQGEIRSDSGRTRLLGMKYDAVQEKQGVHYPTLVQLEFSEEGVELNLEILQIDFNPQLDPKIFQISVPADYSVID